MCPACFTSAALLAGGVISTGGISVLVARIATVHKREKPAATSPAGAPQEFQYPQTKSKDSKGE